VLPATLHKWTHPALTPAMQAGARFTYPGGMEGWVDLVDLIAPRPGIEPATFRSRVQRSTNATTNTTYLTNGVKTSKDMTSFRSFYLKNKMCLRASTRSLIRYWLCSVCPIRCAYFCAVLFLKFHFAFYLFKIFLCVLLYEFRISL